MNKITVKVIPKSKFSKIEKISESDYKIYVKSPPIKGKANQEIIDLLSDYFSIPKHRIKIERGHTSKIKIIKIE